MRLIHPGTNPITVSHWYMLELRSEKTSEETIKRLGKALRKTFQNDSAEIFVPVKERDIDTFTLLTECYVFVRADDVSKIAKLRAVTGVQGVLSKDESLRPANFIKVEDAYVQNLISQCWDAHHRRAACVGVGSWVRLLDGQTRNYCGLVLSIRDGRALVKIDLKTKVLTVDTNIYNLLDLSHVPEAHRVFYYSEPVVQFLKDHGATAEKALVDDLRFDEEAMRDFLTTTEEPPEGKGITVVSSVPKRHTSREQTPTRFVESLMLGGERDVKVLLAKTVEAIRAGTIRRPQTALILWHVIRTVVIRILEIPAPPGKKTAAYTQVLDKFGNSYELTPTQVHEAIPELPFKPGMREPVVTVAPVAWAPASVQATATISPFIREHLKAGDYHLDKLLAHVEEGLRAGTFRAPKSLDSLITLIRRQVLQHFRHTHPNIGIQALVDQYGEGIRVSLPQVRQLYPTMEKTINQRREWQMATTQPLLRRVVEVVSDMSAFTTPTPKPSPRPLPRRSVTIPAP